MTPGSVLEQIRLTWARHALAAETVRSTLGGLSEVNVQVEPLNADAERDGLTRSDLLADVESTLRAAGIHLLSSRDLFLHIATPVLHLDIMTLSLDERYAYSLRLELWQAVRLVRDPAIRTLAVTWSRPQLFGLVSADRLGDIRSTVRSEVEAFVRDIAAAPR
jgi:hypothetical protein